MFVSVSKPVLSTVEGGVLAPSGNSRAKQPVDRGAPQELAPYSATPRRVAQSALVHSTQSRYCFPCIIR